MHLPTRNYLHFSRGIGCHKKDKSFVSSITIKFIEFRQNKINGISDSTIRVPSQS
jgi:hypothetical protein